MIPRYGIALANGPNDKGLTPMHREASPLCLRLPAGGRRLVHLPSRIDLLIRGYPQALHAARGRWNLMPAPF